MQEGEVSTVKLEPEQELVLVSPGRMFPRLQSPPILWLSIAMILIGISCIVLQIFSYVINDYMLIANAGPGIWAGVLFIVTGVLGILASRKKGFCLVVSFLVMCAVCLFLSLAIIIVGALGLARDSGVTPLILNIVLIVLAVLEMVAAIVCSILCCIVVCNDPRQISYAVAADEAHNSRS